MHLKLKNRVAVVVALPAAMALLAPAASAHTVQLGSTDASGATFCDPGYSWVQRTTARTSPRYVAPANGTITSWTTSASGGSATAALKIWRPTSNPQQFKAVGQSATKTVPGTSTATTFRTSITVKKGDVIGLAQISGPLQCLYFVSHKASDITSFISGDPASGPQTFADYTPSTLLNVSATFRAARAAPKRGG